MSDARQARPGSISEQRNRKTKAYIDYGMLFCVVLLIAFGLIMIYSTTAYKSGWDEFKSQFIATILGVFAMIFVAVFPYKIFNQIKIYKNYTLLDLVVVFVMVMSIFMLLTPLKITKNNATRWFGIGPLSVQSAEIVKLGLIMLLASLLSKSKDVLKTLKSEFILLGITAAFTLSLGIISSNLSSAIIIALIGVVMIFTVSQRLRLYVHGALTAGIGATILVLLVKFDLINLGFRSNRILIWLDPENLQANENVDNFQVVQGLYAIGSGGFRGKGIGESIQKINKIPEAQNDMIFTVICEELGFVGAFCVMLLFVALTYRLMCLARKLKNRYDKLIVTGVMAHIALQAVLNIAVVTNTIPNTGVSLPFISYGGSSVLCLLVEIGLVINVCKGLKYGKEEE